ncbi:ubiquitin carboxyl-terminal hydrolase 47-like [Dendronephthya gigantea]|uniref:ubiquitin carboxyl-terminal hydrolase 47-like n=1 Tax=Dendronephthya gigantea TaxID=151771 RepID=UPI00106C7A17|nr:ubiquitin carboxyl-terminal hydrolase 47-like [Dendronephthya gigantea]
MVPGTTLQAVPIDSETLDARTDVICIVQDETNFDTGPGKYHVNLPRSTSILDLYQRTGQEFGYEQDTFLLVWKNSKAGQDSKEMVLETGIETMTLEDVCQPPDKKKQRFFLRQKGDTNPIRIKKGTQEVSASENDALSDGSVSNLFDSSSAASGTSSTTPYYGPYNSTSSVYTDLAKSDTGYVGLVNQAMTCYLNSLLQTLFMTPEFRNAIYKWQFKGSKEEASKSIPYQLQRLFVQLQFSGKRAVETTDVTKSFGWDSSDAWHQHDVQELCRVMFDALETVFKNTDQAELINHLYQGKLKDYVKCLECECESARMDTYLDIPLVIRPFGVNTSHGSVEEALDAFVNPETLEENNQYKCDKCDKLCNAHKGLKFCSFPYLLSFQLKRFAFDYNLLHRIKLNDRMTFPKHLNLNKYVPPEDDDNDESLSQKSDSPSSIETETDSGVSLTSSENDAVTEEDLNDMSMDVGERSTAACAGFDDTQESESMQDLKGPEGPYMYELFSIMIHSGSAIGGHYYAYIKSFKDNQWYSFNDQAVSKITNSDIKRTFGGSDNSSRGYYSSHYSSSANAYMLMYRQIHTDNCVFTSEDDLPQHVKVLVKRLQEDEFKEKEERNYKKSICKIKIFCYHPDKHEMLDKKLEIHKDKTLREATEMARELFDLENDVSLNNCRIVKYDEYNENMELSYEGKEDTDMLTILDGVKTSYLFDLMLEIKKDEDEFPVYKPGAITVKVQEVDVKKDFVSSAFSIRIQFTDSLKCLQDTIRQKLDTQCKHIIMVWERYSSEFCEIKPSENRSLRDENFFKKNKIFVQCTDEDPGETLDSELLNVLDKYSNSITLQVNLPDDVYTTEKHVFNMTIHKNITLCEFKEKVNSKMNSSPEMFKVFRIYSNSQEIEMDRLTETFNTVPDKSKILIKHGRALKTGEFRSKIFLLRINKDQHTEFLLETILSKTMKILDMKANIHEEIKQNCKRDIPVERMRLRRKAWKSPGRIYHNDQKLDDIMICSGTAETFVEELPGPDFVENESQMSVYVKRWRPSKYTFEEMLEIILDSEATVSDLKAKISCLSNIAADDVEVAKGRGSFPFEISALDIHDDYEWNPKGETLRHFPIMVNDDGALFYFRDKTEPLMELSEEKRNEIKKAENARSASNVSKTSYKPKERALKIYTDR